MTTSIAMCHYALGVSFFALPVAAVQEGCGAGALTVFRCSGDRLAHG